MYVGFVGRIVIIVEMRDVVDLRYGDGHISRGEVLRRNQHGPIERFGADAASNGQDMMHAASLSLSMNCDWYSTELFYPILVVHGVITLLVLYKKTCRCAFFL